VEVQIPARLQSGRGLLLVFAWCLIGHGVLLSSAAVADLAAGGDFLARWLPGGQASQVSPWVAAPPISRLLAILVGGLAGFSLARGRAGWLTGALVGVLVLFPWFRRGLVFLFCSDPLALQPFLPVPFWALGLGIGYGLGFALQLTRPRPGKPEDEPTTDPTTWLVGAALVVAAALGLGEACASFASSVSWNGYVDRTRAQIAFEDCTPDAEWRIAFVEVHAPDLVVARVADGCEAMASGPRPSRQRQPTNLDAIRRTPPRGGVSAAVQPLAELPEQEKGSRLAIVYQAMHGGSVERNRGGLARAAAAVQAVRETGVPTVVLDAGSLTNITMSLDGEARTKAGLRANSVLDAAEAIGFDAICPSRGDLALGVDWLQMNASMRDLPYVSSNLRGADYDEPFPAYRLIQAGSWRVGVLCVTSPNPRCGGCTVDDGVEAARAAVAELEALRPDVTICLGDLYGQSGVRDSELVEAVEGIDLFLGSSSSNSTAPMVRIADTLVSRTRSRGIRLELLTITTVLGGQGFHSDEAAAEAAKQRERTASQLENLEGKLARQESGSGSWLEGQIASTRATLAAMDAVDHSPTGRHRVDRTHLSLAREVEDSEVAAILDLTPAASP